MVRQAVLREQWEKRTGCFLSEARKAHGEELPRALHLDPGSLPRKTPELYIEADQEAYLRESMRRGQVNINTRQLAPRVLRTNAVSLNSDY